MSSGEQESPRAFIEWANAYGCDTAHTYDTDRSRWVFFSAMTHDLWCGWVAAIELQRAEREADRAVMREALEALEGATKIIVRVDKGITTLARQEADPLSGLNDVRAAISSLKARTR